MLKLQDSLSQIPLLKNIFDLADTLPDDIEPPWNNEYTEGETVLSDTPVPLILRKIMVANFRSAFNARDETGKHMKSHLECSEQCPTVQRFMKELQDHRVVSSFVQYFIMRHIDNFSAPWIILNDWRIVTPTLASRSKDMFTFQYMFPPTAEEKKHGS